MLNAEEIGKRIQDLIKSKKIKQKDLVEITGKGQTVLSAFMHGRHVPDTETLLKLSNYLNVSIEYLLTGTEKIKLPEDELKLLEQYRLLLESDKQKVIGYIESKLPEPEQKSIRQSS